MDDMPEYLVKVTETSGFVEWKTADDPRHLKKIISGLKGKASRYRAYAPGYSRPKSVVAYIITATTEDVIEEFE